MMLRTKLSLIIGFAVALAIGLTIFLTVHNVGDFLLDEKKKQFAALSQNIVRSLTSTFWQHLHEKTHMVQYCKEFMSSIVRNTQMDIRAVTKTFPPEMAKPLIHQLLRNLTVSLGPTSEKITLTMMTVRELRTQGLPKANISATTKNVKQQTLAQLLVTLDEKGAFSLWNNQDSYLLNFLLPMQSSRHGLRDEDQILIGFMPLAELLDEIEALQKNRLSAIRQDIAKLSFYDKGLLLLVNAQGKTVVERGDTSFKEELLRLRNKDLGKGTLFTETSLDDKNEEYLCYGVWIPAYKWYLLVSAPITELLNPTYKLLQNLLFWAFNIMLVAMLVGLASFWYAVRPLQHLRKATFEIAKLDFTTKESLEQLKASTSKLNLNAHDEPGDLARSFVNMAEALAKNVMTTMAVMTNQKRLEGELQAARDIQLGILPVLDTINVPFLTISAFLEPAREVGGDLYDCFTTPDNRVAIVMGDVSGKGIPAALFMTMTVTLIRYALGSGLDPAAAMDRINAILESHNPGNMFVTLFLLLYAPESGEILYANGGHCPPYLVCPDGSVRTLDKLSGPLVGAMPEITYLLYQDTLAFEESCLLFTDGLNEAMNADKDLYGTDRLQGCLKKHAKDDPKKLIEAIFNDICAFRGSEPASDDLAMLVFKRTKTPKALRAQSL